MYGWMDGWMGFSNFLFWFEIRDLLGWMGRVRNNVFGIWISLLFFIMMDRWMNG